MKKHKVKGSVVGVKVEDPIRWYVRLSADCPVGKQGEVVTVLGVKTESDGLEIEI
jgi:hypothetical protein